MPTFRSLSEASRILNKNVDVLIQGEFIKIMKMEAIRLENIIKDEIQNYYDTYTPSGIYERTYNWRDSIRVSEPYIEGSVMMVKIYFDDNMSYHPSIIDSSKYPLGYVPWLMEVGWHISGNVQPRRNGFTDFDGIHYITKAIEKFNMNNPYNIKISANSKWSWS